MSRRDPRQNRRVVPPVSGGSAPFTPASISGLAVWLDSTKGVTQGGGKATAWADQSGNGRNWSAGSTGVIYTAADAAFNGMPSLGGSGNSDTLTANATMSTIMNGATAAEYFMVIKMASAASSFTNAGWGTSGSPSFFYFSSDSNIYDSAFSTVRNHWLPGQSVASAIVYNVFSSAGNYTANIGGVQSFTTATNTYGVPATAPTILTSGQNASMASLVVYEQVLSGAQRTNVLNYLTAKFL